MPRASNGSRRIYSPPFHFFEVAEDRATLPVLDAQYDLIWAFSVFTHIADQWSTWLLELHRTLRTGGLALISFLGRHMLGEVLGEDWNPDLIGMNTLRRSQSWDVGGPTIFHSEWWVRAHWGRAFEVFR